MRPCPLPVRPQHCLCVLVPPCPPSPVCFILCRPPTPPLCQPTNPLPLGPAALPLPSHPLLASRRRCAPDLISFIHPPSPRGLYSTPCATPILVAASESDRSPPAPDWLGRAPSPQRFCCAPQPRAAHWLPVFTTTPFSRPLMIPSQRRGAVRCPDCTRPATVTPTWAGAGDYKQAHVWRDGSIIAALGRRIQAKRHAGAIRIRQPYIAVHVCLCARRAGPLPARLPQPHHVAGWLVVVGYSAGPAIRAQWWACISSRAWSCSEASWWVCGGAGAGGGGGDWG